MKTLLKPLLVAFSLGLVTLSASVADANPIGRRTAAATYKASVYPTIQGKLQIALDKETGGTVVVQSKDKEGQVLFSQHVGKNETTSRLRLNLSELPDGAYQVEITNGVDTTTHSVKLSTQKPDAPARLVAIN